MAHAVLEGVVWLLGLCVGSFVNVVVYRLPAGLSIHRPKWSFCPHCKVTLAWYDNIPLMSWIWLGGRCRRCRGPISAQYPLVEGLTGLTFVLVYHLLFVTESAGIGPAALPRDLPLLLSWLVLAAGLVACSAMDIVSYSIDVRVTGVVLGAAIVLHALWPRAELLGARAGSATAAAAVAAFVVSGLMVWWCERRAATPEEESSGDASAEVGGGDVAPSRLPGYVSMVVFVALAGGLMGVARVTDHPAWLQGLTAAALLAVFGALVLAGGEQRPADAEIKAAIEEERPQARRTVLKELAWLLPAIVLAGLALALVDRLPQAGRAWSGIIGWSPGGGFVPVAGAVYAIHGAIIGALAGWVLRIGFTLALGREAFGVGDIHILAAAGAAGGWDIALLGLLLSVGIAMAGWLLSLLRKRTVMIPFGPCLALGFVQALWWQQPAQRIAESRGRDLAYAWQERPDLLLIAGGLMLVGTAAALAAARLVRRWVAPDAT
jgi:leader peptidase (prepilin peptidase)/N-methyltransferase